VTALIIGIVSIPLVPVCGLGILTAIVGFIIAVSARRVAARAAEGARGLATAGIVVNGVLLGLAAVGLGIFGLTFVGTLGTTMLPTQRPSIEARKSPVHEVPTLTSPRATEGKVLPTPTPPRATEGVVPPTPSLLAQTVVLGESAKVGALRLAALAYSETDKCPDGGGRPAQAAKFVIVEASVRNDGTEIMDLPRIHWTLDSHEASLGAGHSCRYNQRAFGNACWTSAGRLFPGAECEGWLLFEVPEGLAVESAMIRAQVSPRGGGVPGTVTWQARR
jgi:hypothetical protein